MDVNRFKRILEYSKRNRTIMEDKVREFYVCSGMETNNAFLNLMQIVRPLFQDKGYIIVELPFRDKEIGALCYKGESIGYTFLNSSLPKVNTNFALCHEIYHVFYQEKDFKRKVELYINEHYYQHDEEFAANLFAGMLLMPEQSFRFMYAKFQKEEKPEDGELSVLAKLMNYYEVPYMAALIRCYELELLDAGEILEELMHVSNESVRNEFNRLWLDESILDATGKDDYRKFELLVSLLGDEYTKKEYVNGRTADKALQNMRKLYLRIREE